jgi:ABC-type transport system involved in Fe-S cluster assembly fused permease/ATPase subunit
VNELLDESSKVMHDGLSNVRSVKSFGNEREEVLRYCAKWAARRELEYERDNVVFSRTAVQHAVQTIMRILLVIYSYFAICNGEMTVGTMTYVLITPCNFLIIISSDYCSPTNKCCSIL